MMIQILIAVPDSAERKALVLLLQRKLGITGIFEAGDVETLIRTLADTPPDLLLLDWKLYGSPAPETCRLLQKAYVNLKVILLSVDADDATAAKKAGAMFVHKGAAPAELINMLEPLLTEKKKDDQQSLDHPL